MNLRQFTDGLLIIAFWIIIVYLINISNTLKDVKNIIDIYEFDKTEYCE